MVVIVLASPRHPALAVAVAPGAPVQVLPRAAFDLVDRAARIINLDVQC
jgi:hypothetical protein